MMTGAIRDSPAVTVFNLQCDCSALSVQSVILAIRAILHLPDVAARMNEMGAEIMGGSVESFTAFHRTEFERWTTFAKNSGIKPQ